MAEEWQSDAIRLDVYDAVRFPGAKGGP